MTIVTLVVLFGWILWNPGPPMLREYIRRGVFTKEGGLSQEINDDLGHLYKAAGGRNGREQSTDALNDNRDIQKMAAPFKIVVFIDDLDRCPPNKAVEVLEAIKIILEQPFLIVFMAVDTRLLVKAVEDRYQGTLPKTVHPGGPGMEYLEKIIQIPFWMPHEDMKTYWSNMLSMSPNSDVENEKPQVEDDQQESSGQTEPVPSLLNKISAWFQDRTWTPWTPGRFARKLPPEATASERRNEERVSSVAPPIVPPNTIESNILEDYWGFSAANPRGAKRVVNVFKLAKSLSATLGIDWQSDFEKTTKLIIIGERWADFWMYCYPKIHADQIADDVSLATFWEGFKSHKLEMLASEPDLPHEIKSAHLAELELLKQLLDKGAETITVDDARRLKNLAVNLPSIRSWDSVAAINGATNGAKTV
ncbi:MAG: P-loop NTPase fold protein [SAR202 cluster bacterium]|nr:P-loop NTPase fold protein [SAR202 cluster bacterium]